MQSINAVDLGPLWQLLLLAGLLAVGPLLWVLLRTRGASPGRRVRALTMLTLFLTFDLVLFGAFTRLTDSGLGCPDWPGCYGSASPLGARESIQAAQSAMPTGPVTHGKAWIEMIHRYLAMSVGALIVAITVLSWRLRRTGQPAGDAEPSPWWPTATLGWVLLQGAFGAWTVTLKLYPAIVTAHLIGGLVLLALLARQAWVVAAPTAVPAGLRVGIALVGALTLMQVALGGWVSANYAVLACTEFPMCQGSWWPPMNFDQGFSVLRPLGLAQGGGWLPFEALTAIHMAHRLGAAVLLLAVFALAANLFRRAALRPLAWGLVGAMAWQVATGVSNVVLGWPLVAAVAHTGGAAALALLLSALWVRTCNEPSAQAAPVPTGYSGPAASLHRIRG
jgi:cytochrome c oxidase assembly protein subunit 15